MFPLHPAAAVARAIGEARFFQIEFVFDAPARFVGEEEGKAILKAWLDTPFAGGRHARRVAKIERDENSTEENR